MSEFLASLCRLGVLFTADTADLGRADCINKGSEKLKPFLAQFGEPPTPALKQPSFEIRQPVGLAYRLGSDIPFVDELIAEAEYQSSSMQTVVTASKEQVDPDRIRGEIFFSTNLTEAAEDPNDPDRVRDQIFGSQLLHTLLTRTEKEPDDPDRVRNAPSVWLGTMLTKSDEDPSDPDRVRGAF